MGKWTNCLLRFIKVLYLFESSLVKPTKPRQIRTDLAGFLLLSVLFGCVCFLASGVTHALTHTGIDWDRTGQHRRGFSRPVLPFLEIFLLHRLTDDRADGVRRILLHLGCGVGVGVEGEACGVVAQGSREGFHVYAVLEGQGGEKMPLWHNKDKSENPCGARS